MHIKYGQTQETETYTSSLLRMPQIMEVFLTRTLMWMFTFLEIKYRVVQDQKVKRKHSDSCECERNEGFWSESDRELSDNVVAGGEVQAAGNEIRPYQFEPEADKQRKMAMKFPAFMMIGRTSKEDLAITTG